MTVSCNLLSDLEDRVDNLEARIQVIETIIPTLNGNIEALKALAEANCIVSVETVDNNYKLTLSDGRTINLKQGSIGSSNAPVLSIDNEGFWMVDYKDGYGSDYILVDGNKASAIGKDGITPLFGVDRNGYWTVSYDNGETYTTVKDTDGKEVSALPSYGADEYFKEISIKDGIFTITLDNGEKISMNIIGKEEPQIIFIINATSDIQKFEPGEIKTYKIVSKGIVSASVITKPKGWSAVLTDEALIVSAPQEASQTKISADSEKDISILALSENGTGILAKIQVELEDTTTETPDNDVEE